MHLLNIYGSTDVFYYILTKWSMNKVLFLSIHKTGIVHSFSKTIVFTILVIIVGDMLIFFILLFFSDSRSISHWLKGLIGAHSQY